MQCHLKLRVYLNSRQITCSDKLLPSFSPNRKLHKRIVHFPLRLSARSSAKQKAEPPALHPPKSKTNHSKRYNQSPEAPPLHTHWGSRTRWGMLNVTHSSRWGRRERMDKYRDLHPTKALPIAANEVIPLRLIQGYEIFATAPVPGRKFCRAVVIPCLVYLKHIVLVLLVPKRCSKNKFQKLHTQPKMGKKKLYLYFLWVLNVESRNRSRIYTRRHRNR
jgi:hypothetical protein